MISFFPTLSQSLNVTKKRLQPYAFLPSRNDWIVKRLLSVVIAGVLLLGNLSAALLACQNPVSFVDSSEKIQRATVTVYLDFVKPIGHLEEGVATEPQRIVTGIAVAPNLVVCPMFISSSHRVGLGLPTTEEELAGHRVGANRDDQAVGRVVVVDEYSGLCLIWVKDHSLDALQVANELPRIGSWLLSAAVWQNQKPVLTYGMVSGVDRTLDGTTYPPLLLCDLRTAPASLGAAVADDQAKLMGIVVASSAPERRGWSYAVPAHHVRRLMRVYKSNLDRLSRGEIVDADDELIVLKRRRPTVGMELMSINDTIIVTRLADQGPAMKAGLKAYDRIVKVNDKEVRNVYQAVVTTRSLQPGDAIRFSVDRKDQDQGIEFEVILGGGVFVDASRFAEVQQFVRPKINLEEIDRNLSVADGLRPTPSSNPIENSPAEADSIAETYEFKIQVLSRALQNYQSAIEIQRRQLQEQLQTLSQLKEENEQLQKDLGPKGQ